jgi:hypothetical protein
MMLLRGWTAEQVTLLAPDPDSAKNGKKLATPKSWLTLGTDGTSAWGEIKGSGSKPYQVKIDLLRLANGEKPELSLACTCASRKLPCKHCLGLLHLIVDQPKAIPQAQPPAFVTEWLDKVAQRARRDMEKKKRAEEGGKVVDPKQREKTFNERKARIVEGLTDLELWLTNVIRHGLADPQLEQRNEWNARAKRLHDAQAPGVATWLQALGASVKIGDDWAEKLLANLGRLELLIQGFKNYDTLPEAMQADLRAAAGWTLKKEEVGEAETVADRWLVTGRRELPPEDKIRGQRLWLRGEATGRDALIAEFAFGDLAFDTYLAPGQVVDGALSFFPGNFVLRAFIAERREIVTADPSFSVPGASIAEGIAAYGAALALNPWLPQFPLLLDHVIPMRHGGGWVVREPGGEYLPIATTFQHKWSLLALGGYATIRIAGEWDGTEFYPTCAIVEGRFVDFNRIGKLV